MALAIHHLPSISLRLNDWVGLRTTVESTSSAKAPRAPHSHSCHKAQDQLSTHSLSALCSLSHTHTILIKEASTHTCFSLGIGVVGGGSWASTSPSSFLVVGRRHSWLNNSCTQSRPPSSKYLACPCSLFGLLARTQDVKKKKKNTLWDEEGNTEQWTKFRKI